MRISPQFSQLHLKTYEKEKEILVHSGTKSNFPYISFTETKAQIWKHKPKFLWSVCWKSRQKLSAQACTRKWTSTSLDLCNSKRSVLNNTERIDLHCLCRCLDKSNSDTYTYCRYLCLFFRWIPKHWLYTR